MLILQIVLQILVLAVAILTSMLAHRWHDRRTARHKVMFAGLICILVLTALVNVAVTILDSWRASNRAQLFSDDIRELTATNTVLVAQVAEITTWNASFRPLTDARLQSFRAQLAALKNEYGPQALPIRFQCETGSAPRSTLGEQLGWIVGTLDAGHFQRGTFSGFYPGASIEVLCPSNSIPYMDAVIRVMNHKQRQLAAIRHETPDRIPVDAQAVENTDAVARLLGIPASAVGDTLGLDGFLVGLGYAGSVGRDPDGNPLTEWGTPRHMDWGTTHVYPALPGFRGDFLMAIAHANTRMVV